MDVLLEFNWFEFHYLSTQWTCAMQTCITAVWLLACSTCQPAIGLTITCHAEIPCCNDRCNAREQATQVSFEPHVAQQLMTRPCRGMFSCCAIAKGSNASSYGQMVCQAMPLIVQMLTNAQQTSFLTVQSPILKPCQLYQTPFADWLCSACT